MNRIGLALLLLREGSMGRGAAGCIDRYESPLSKTRVPVWLITLAT